jgi:hypothetical protein
MYLLKSAGDVQMDGPSIEQTGWWFSYGDGILEFTLWERRNGFRVLALISVTHRSPYDEFR